MCRANKYQMMSKYFNVWLPHDDAKNYDTIASAEGTLKLHHTPVAF